MPARLAKFGAARAAQPLQAGLPELVGSVKYRKGVYAAEDGDFATTGAAATGALVDSGEKVFINWTYGQNWYAIRTGASSVDVRIVPVK